MIFRFLVACFRIGLICLSVFGCASDGSDSESQNSGRRRYVPLSLEDSKVLITPTIYYIPQFDVTSAACAGSGFRKVKNDKNEILAELCEKDFKQCLMQGTCKIKKGTDSFLLNYHKKNGADFFFKKVDQGKCSFGYGSKNSVCLDPYYTVAADPNLYNVGDVILIPELRGLRLPNGSAHEGFVIVRDTGAAIRGHGRFDFFIGFDLIQTGNAFVSLGLNDKSTHYPYQVLSPEEAKSYLELRQFPKMPVR